MKFEAFERLPEKKQQSILSAGIAEFAMKSYNDASTDCITSACGISKGLLFHYFGSKKEFYLYCLGRALDRLLADSQPEADGNFYDILFSFMDKKIAQCIKLSDETRMVNMASREGCAAVAQGKARVMLKYRTATALATDRLMTAAVAALPVKLKEPERVKEGLRIYLSAVINKYLVIYQSHPEEFFSHIDEIKDEFREYIDLMLYGITAGTKEA